jgi:sialate O-acetylesterase
MSLFVALLFLSLRFDQPLSDHAVLQRGQAIQIEGEADPATRLEVVLADERRSTTSSDAGHWAVTFSAKPEGGPYTIRVQNRHESSEIQVVG